jgi:histidinol-phosphatase (PHP family)
MIQSDYHVHSSFSGDCDTHMELFIKYAINNNITNICFTDHHDMDLPNNETHMELDFKKYFIEYNKLKEKYYKQINIYIGIELGIQTHLFKQLDDLVNQHSFDFVLCSSHVVKRSDPYYPSYFETRSQYEGYFDYFEDILYNVKNYNNYECYGHLDYIVRYGNFKEKKLEYNQFKDMLDEILLTIINNNKGIELNTSGYRYGLNSPHPNYDILKRYKELGGEIITIGSDSHKPEDIGSHFSNAKALLESLGYKYYTIFKNRKAEFYKL